MTLRELVSWSWDLLKLTANLSLSVFLLVLVVVLIKSVYVTLTGKYERRKKSGGD